MADIDTTIKTDSRKFIVYDENHKPWPDEITHISIDEVKEELIAKISEKINKMSLTELKEIAVQVNIVVEEI